MATGLVDARPTLVWSEVTGAAASVASVTWQNTGMYDIVLSFQTSSPADTDPIVLLKPGDAVTDDTGSAHIWARATHVDSSRVCAWTF